MKFPSFLPPLRGRFLAAAAMFAALASSSLADTLPRPSGATFSRGALFTVTGYAAGKPALSGFPVLLRLSAGSPAGFAYNQLQSWSTGDDLAFVDMNGNGLPFEIDTWDPTGTSLIWVRLPSMENGTKFAMYWNSESSGKDLCADGPWGDYTGVWHLNEDAAGITTIHDSTENALDGTTVSTSTSKTDGKIGRARLITTNTSNTAGQPYDSGITVDLADADKLAAVDSLAPAFTASMWIRPQNTSGKSQWNYLVTRKQGDKDGGWGAQFNADDNKFNPLRIYAALETDNGKVSTNKDGDTTWPHGSVVTGTSSGISKGSWAKLDVSWTSDGKFCIYVNGQQRQAPKALANNATAMNNGVAKLALGGALAPTNSLHKTGRGFYGDMDEIRLHPGALSSDWIAADYATQNDAAFLTAGTAEDIDMAAPAGFVEAGQAGYTNAIATLHLYALGEGASSADVRMEIAATQDFANPLWSTEFTIAVVGETNVMATGLTYGTTYWLRGSLTNNLGGVLGLDPVSFTTATPGAPEGTAEVAVRGLTTLSVTGKATAFGEGATSATMRLEASADASFATLAGVSPEVAATPDAQQTLEVSGLGADTEYRLRLRLVNDWGVETFVALPATPTLDGPVDASDIRWTFSSDVTTVDVFLDVNAVFDGGTGTATLYCDENDEPTTPRGDRTVSEPGTLTWAAIPFGGEALHARIVLESEAGGTVYTQAWIAVVDHNFKRLRPIRLPVTFERVENPLQLPGTVLNPADAFDGSLSTGVPSMAHFSVVGSLTNLLERPQDEEVYISRLEVTHKGDSKYTLYTSIDGTDWTLVENATNAQYAGTASYPVVEVANFVKCTFETSMDSYSVTPSLFEIEAWGFVKAKAKNLAKNELAWVYKADGSACAPESGNSSVPEAFGGGSHMSWFFNDNFTDNVYVGPNNKLNAGSYCLVDFSKSSDMPSDGWFITEIRTGSNSTNEYSLYYSMDGHSWTAVNNGTNVGVKGQKIFPVNDTAVYVKCVFDQVGGWTPSFNELQVWGLSPEDVPCTHPSYTPWTPVAGSATCLKNGIDVQYCTECGERVTRESTTLRLLGHDYVNTLDRPGKFKEFGSGSIACSRCGFRLDFHEPLDLVTNRVDGSRIGDVRTEGFVRFTEVTVTSTGQTEYGVRPEHLIGDNWTWAWNNYWFSLGNDPDPHVDFKFGTEVDLIYIDISLPNSTHSTQFYSVDDATGTETQLGGFLVYRTDTVHAYTIPGPEPADIYSDKEHDELVVVNDARISPNALNENGKVVYDSAGKPVPNNDNYQRFTIRFYEQPIKHLRVRQTKDDGETVKKPMEISELHPWGIVHGAGDLRYRKETIMILR